MQQNMIGNIAMRDDDVNTNQRPEHLSIEIPQKNTKTLSLLKYQMLKQTNNIAHI